MRIYEIQLQETKHIYQPILDWPCRKCIITQDSADLPQRAVSEETPSRFSPVRIAQCEHRTTSQPSEYNRSSARVNNGPEWLPSLSSKQNIGCCHINGCGYGRWRIREYWSTAVRTKFARATRKTVTPMRKCFGFMPDDRARLYHRSWAASRRHGNCRLICSPPHHRGNMRTLSLVYS